MKNDELEIVPGVIGEPLFTPKEYEAFREWWREEVAPQIRELEDQHAKDWPFG